MPHFGVELNGTCCCHFQVMHVLTQQVHLTMWSIGVAQFFYRFSSLILTYTPICVLSHSSGRFWIKQSWGFYISLFAMAQFKTSVYALLLLLRIRLFLHWAAEFTYLAFTGFLVSYQLCTISRISYGQRNFNVFIYLQHKLFDTKFGPCLHFFIWLTCCLFRLELHTDKMLLPMSSIPTRRFAA